MERFDFQELVERLPLVIYVDELDELSSPRYVSPQIERMLGYTQDEWHDDPELWARSIHPDDRERVLADVARRNELGTSTEMFEYRLLAHDGRIVWVRDDEFVGTDDRGRPSAAHGYLQDISDRRLDGSRLELLVGILSGADAGHSPEEIIAKAADRLAALIGNVTVTYAEIDPAGRALTVSYSTRNSAQEIWEDGEWSTTYVERLRQGVPIAVGDVAGEAWLAPVQEQLRRMEIASFVDVPLLRDGELAGVLWFNCDHPRDWSAGDVTTLHGVAGELAVVLANARSRQELRRRDAILQAVSQGAARLLAEPSWLDAATELFERLGIAAEASRVYVFESGFRADGKRIVSQSFEWVAPEVSSELGKPLTQGVCLVEAGLGALEECSLRGEIYSRTARRFSPEERELFEQRGIRSILAVPIFVGTEWWGFIGLDDCIAEREWSAAVTDALHTAASLVAAAIGRARSEASVREHEHKLQAVFDTALDAIVITDDERRYVDVNPAGCELIGVPKDDLLGRYVDEFLPPSRRAHVVETWGEHIEGGPIHEIWETLRPDGRIVISEASARPHFVPGLNIGFMRDITERKRLEADLLSSQKLESLGRLAGGIAHDFNNLLTGISGYAQLLLERGEGDDELRRDAEEIERASGRAAELTRQLLAFGRRQVLEPQPLDLNERVTEIGALLRRVLGERIELELRPGADLGTVHADPGQVEQVILNLAMNARDAMPAGGRLTIETRNGEVDTVELIVTDTGTGMDEETMSRIFEPFFTNRAEGVGLGLASVHGIVHQSGGDVTVASVPGEGSIFTVRLPRILEKAVSLAKAAVEPAAPGWETILLVEDEDVVRELARRVLEMRGYTVLACANGAEAIELAESHGDPIHLLLTDVVMPGLRGYEVAARVVLSRPEIKILYMSGYAEEAFADNPAITAATLIGKPFAIDELTHRVHAALQRP